MDPLPCPVCGAFLALGLLVHADDSGALDATTTREEWQVAEDRALLREANGEP